jgi:putative inorganic carbon (HCO3(-)) transporter
VTARLDDLGARIARAEWRSLALLVAIAAAVGTVAGLVGLYRIAFVVGLAPFVVIAYRNLAAGCVLIVLSSPVVALGSISVGFHLLPCYLFVAAALAGLVLRGELRSFAPRTWDWLLFAFLLVAATISVANVGALPHTTVLAATGANSPHLRSLAQMAAIALMAALYLVLRVHLVGSERLEVLVRALLVATGFVALYAAYQFFGRKLGLPYTFVNVRRPLTVLPRDSTYLRVNSTLTEASPLAQYMITGLLLGLVWLRSPASRPGWISRRASALLTAGAVAVMAATLSVAGGVACALYAPIVLALGGRRWRRRIAVATACVLVAGIVIVLPHYRGGGSDPRDVVKAERYVREGFWRAAVNLTKDHPFGVGVGNFPFYYPLYAPLAGRYEYQVAVSDAHNVFLDVAAETGVVGFLLFVSFYVSMFVAALRSVLRAGRRLVGGALPNIGLVLSMSFVAGATMHLTYSYPYYPFEWVLAGMVGSLPLLLARESPP